ncbi:hypothetical protein [Halanaerobacter jeridensis]|uniref:Uncharacterized protein n=1 Tax=Halanaerobacter jeridensis TaxID=706427 RepID=A0A938XS34_9FIRM|nr:hypothetical protein [Halanaerobacter jeridensis]MBM7555236.1 hypothetical protein [Halanaerobacter jeridensis]
MAKLIKQFFDLINPENNEKSSGVVIKLELESETKKFIDFYSFLSKCPNPNQAFEKNMQKKQTVNMKIADEKAKNILENYRQNKDFTEL